MPEFFIYFSLWFFHTWSQIWHLLAHLPSYLLSIISYFLLGLLFLDDSKNNTLLSTTIIILSTIYRNPFFNFFFLSFFSQIVVVPLVVPLFIFPTLFLLLLCCCCCSSSLWWLLSKIIYIYDVALHYARATCTSFSIMSDLVTKMFSSTIIIRSSGLTNESTTSFYFSSMSNVKCLYESNLGLLRETWVDWCTA